MIKKIVLFFLCLIVLATPTAIRALKDTPNAGDWGYLYLRRADGLVNGGFSFYDQLSFSGRSILLDGQSIVLAFFGLFFGLGLAYKILPIFFGLLSFILFYDSLERLKTSNKYFSSFLLISSPVFIYTFSFFNELFLAVFLGVLIYWLLLREKENYAAVFLFLIPFFNLTAFFLSCAFLIIWGIKRKKILRVAGLALIFWLFYFFIRFKSAPYLGYLQADWALIFETGHLYGLSIFTLILVFFGFLILWKKKYCYNRIYISILLLLLTSFYTKFGLAYIIFFLAPIGAVGWANLQRRKWESNEIKRVIVALIIFGLLFSSYSAIKSILVLEPTNELIEALQVLKRLDEGIVFSDASNGFLINYFAQKKNFADQDFFYAPDAKQRHLDLKELFYSDSNTKIRDLMRKYNVNYILIDKRVREHMLKSNSNLLYFWLEKCPESVPCPRTFSKVYSTDNVAIWKKIN